MRGLHVHDLGSGFGAESALFIHRRYEMIYGLDLRFVGTANIADLQRRIERSAESRRNNSRCVANQIHRTPRGFGADATHQNANREAVPLRQSAKRSRLPVEGEDHGYESCHFSIFHVSLIFRFTPRAAATS